jgi:hypothetical protein
MKKKPTNLKKLIKKADSLWSLCVRNRDGECVLCGSKNALQAHHWIVTRNQSNKYKYDLRNGVTLCYGCHIHGVHRNPSVYLLDRLKTVCIARRIATQEDINEITANRHEVHKRGVGEMENIVIALQSYLENHSGDGVSIDEGGLPTVLANSGEVK